MGVEIVTSVGKLDWLMITTEQTEIDNNSNMAEGIFSYLTILLFFNPEKLIISQIYSLLSHWCHLKNFV